MAVYRMTPPGRRLLCISLLIVILTFTYLYLFSKPQYSQIPNYAPLRKTHPSSKVAIATFLSGGEDPSAPIEDDFYFQAARTLTYQLLHDPKTRSKRADIPFLVLCTQGVAISKLKRLELDGAIVVVVADVPLPYWISTGVTRWKDQFTKLRIFEMVEYERVLFIDADTLIVEPIDGIFDEVMIQIPMTSLLHRTLEVKNDEKPLPSNYSFAARSDNAFSGGKRSPFPPTSDGKLLSGILVSGAEYGDVRVFDECDGKLEEVQSTYDGAELAELRIQEVGTDAVVRIRVGVECYMAEFEGLGGRCKEPAREMGSHGAGRVKREVAESEE